MEYYCLRTQMSWDATTNMTKMGEFFCYQCFYWGFFTVSRWTYIEPYGKNYQADTDALNNDLVENRGRPDTEEKLVSVKILCEWNVSQISISTNVVSTKWYRLGINAIFLATEARINLKGVLIAFHLVLFWCWGVRLDFLKNAH